MIFLTKTYLNQYIYSPITKCHKINLYLKVSIVYSTMCIILYLAINKLVVMAIAIFVIFTLVQLRDKVILMLSNIMIDNLFYLLYMCILNYWVNDSEIIKKDMKVNHLIILNNIRVNTNKKNCQIKYYRITYCIPKYLLKIIYIYILYSNLSQILFIFTQSQSIIEAVIYCLNQIYAFTKITYNRNITNLHLSYQSLEHIINIWRSNSIGQQIKGGYFNRQISINILITSYMNMLGENSNNSILLWNRHLFYDSFINLKYYY